MPSIDTLYNSQAQYNQEYRLSVILDMLNYEIMSIEMVKERHLSSDFLVAKVVVVNRSNGMISCPQKYLRHYTEDSFDDSFLGQCDDLNIRFSIFFNRTGFFSPLWTGLIKNGHFYPSAGPRMDWDVYRNVAPRISAYQYTTELREAGNRTIIENDEVVLRTIPKWLLDASCGAND